MGVIAKYKFNNTLEANLLPEFNSEFTSDLYTVTDEVNGDVTTRTIESDSLPTLMRFGRVYVDGESTTDNRTNSLLEVLEMNTSELTNCYSIFRYCTNLTSISCEWDTSNVTDTNAMFHNCNNLTTLDLSNFDTSKVTNMGNMFNGCKNLTTLDLSNFNTSNTTSMPSMFYDCTNLTTLDLSNFNTSNVTNMGHMFFNCNNLTSLDVSNFDTRNVCYMDNMFCGCNNLTSLDVSNWDTSKVTNMQQMFRLCGQLIELDANNWNTSKVEDMYAMFNSCSSLTSLNVSNWNTSSLISAPELFYNCSKLTSLNLSKWNTSNVVGMGFMFGNCSSLTTLDISNFDTNKVTTMTDMLTNTNNLKYLKCNNVTTLNTLNSQLPTKSSASQGTIICKSDITNLDTTTLQSKYWNITDELTLVAKYVFDKSIHNNCIPSFNTEFEGYFIEDEVVEGNNEVVRTIESCGMLPTLMRFGQEWASNEVTSNKSLSLLEVLNINTDELTIAKDMFRNCANVKNICMYISNKINSIYGIFENCNKLEKVDVSKWDTSQVTNMYCVFGSCNKLEKVDVSKWDTSQVTNMRYLFLNCNSLTSIDVSNFDTREVANIEGMFQNCYNLTSLDVSNFDTSNVTATGWMFNNTPLLKDIGMLYCNASTIQKIINAMPTDSNKTLWYKNVDIDGITHGDNITLKKYMEENVEIVLNSPLLKGDTIEIVDGKLCHVHRYEKIVLDGSEDEPWIHSYTFDNGIQRFRTKGSKSFIALNSKCICNNFWFDDKLTQHGDALACSLTEMSHPIYEFQANLDGSLSSSIGNSTVKFCEWLQANPITVVYELASPYYEDITPLQSSLALRTFKECNIQIITALPIKTKITYRTNITSAIVMEQELDTLDSGVSLSNLIEEEVNE